MDATILTECDLEEYTKEELFDLDYILKREIIKRTGKIKLKEKK